MIRNLNLIGKIDIINDFDKIFSKNMKFLVTNVINDEHYFEMTGESMYYALKECEEISAISQLERKEKIISSLQNRKKACNGVFVHKSFIGENDTQLRSTSAVIRTFLEARKDGFTVDHDIIEVVNHHYSHYFKWNTGIWFCHDTSELKGNAPLSHVKTKAFNKSKKNTLTLNTHLDSLTTLFMVINSNIECNADLEVLANKAIQSLNILFKFDKNKNYLNNILQKIDNAFFDHYLISLSRNKENLLSKFYQKIIHPTFFKIISPTVFFKNGFIARDLAVLNIHVDYLTVNITDFLRLLIVYDKVTQKSLNRLRKLDRESILDKVSSAIDLIETNKNLKSYILASDLQSAWYAELHYLYSFYDSKYKNIVKEIEQSNLYNLRTTSFADMIIKKEL